MMTPAPDPTEATTAVVTSTPKAPFIPRSNRILIRPDKISKMAGSIAIPDNANALDEGRHWSGLTCRTAKILSVGPGLYVTYSKWIGHRDETGQARWPMHGVGPGMRILYRAWAGNDVVIDGEKLQVISVNVVDAIILEDGRLDLVEDRLLVRRRKRLERTKGGIWIPEVAQKEPLEGEVLQTGPGKIVTNGTRIPFDAQVGERVAWRPMKGVNVTLYDSDAKKDQETVLLFESDLIGVLEGAENFEPVVSKNREQ